MVKASVIMGLQPKDREKKGGEKNYLRLNKKKLDRD